jgi:hypothetical protein
VLAINDKLLLYLLGLIQLALKDNRLYLDYLGKTPLEAAVAWSHGRAHQLYILACGDTRHSREHDTILEGSVPTLLQR